MSIFRKSTPRDRLEATQAMSSDIIAINLQKKWGVSLM
jgi:hypothetical protein